MSNLDELERLLEAATPLGFWQPDGKHGIGAGGFVITCGAYNEYGCGDPANRALIVAAVNSLPALIASARRAEALSELLDRIPHPEEDWEFHNPDLPFEEWTRQVESIRATLTGEGAPR